MQREITNQFLEVELPAIFYDEQGAQYIEFFAQLGQSYLLNLMELYFKHKEISFPYTHGDFIVEGGATKELAFLRIKVMCQEMTDVESVYVCWQYENERIVNQDVFVLCLSGTRNTDIELAADGCNVFTSYVPLIKKIDDDTYNVLMDYQERVENL